MKPFQSISAQILLAVLITVISVLGISSIIELKRLKQRKTEFLKENATVTADRIANSLAYPLWNLNQEETEQVVLYETAAGEVFRIQVFDEDGSLYVGKVKGPDGLVRNINAASAGALHVPQASMFSLSRGVNFRNTNIGRVILDITDANLESDLVDMRQDVMLRLVGLAVILSVVLFITLRTLVIRPLSTLKLWVEKIPSLSGSPPPRFKLSGEIDSLAEAFGSMSANLTEKTTEIEGERIQLQELNRQLQAEIEDRNRTEKALRASEERFIKIFNLSPYWMGIVQQKDGMIIQVNDTWVRQSGYERDEIVNHHFFELNYWLSEEAKSQIQCWFNEGKTFHSWEGRVRTKTGEDRMTLSSAELVELGGEPCYLWAINDITERKRAEEQLMKSEAQLAEAQRVAHVGSFEWDAATNKSSWSDEFYRILGLEPQSIEVSDELVASYLTPSEHELLKELFRRTIRSNEPFTSEYKFAQADGEVRVVQVRGQQVRNEAGEITKVIGTVQDITELKEAEEALRKSEEQFLQAQKMEAIGQLAGGVAHDFNNLVTAITGYSDLTLRKLDKTDPLRRNIEEIKKAGERAASLTRQLLAFSRKQVLQPQVIDLNSVVADMAEMLPRLIGENITLTTSLDPTLGSVKADPGQLEQIFLNLAVNARDAMPEGGKLTVETQNVYMDKSKTVGHGEVVAPGPYIVLVVSDTGHGMDTETMARIFEPFFTTKPAGKGTGLGLSTVYGIVKQSGGNIAVYSEPGLGTTFKIYLPRTIVGAEEYQKQMKVAEVPRGTETVLLVEDEDMVRELAREVLEFNGYEVLEAAGGAAALQLCKQHPGPIHLLLTDVVMPEISGRSLAESALQLRPEMRVLYMSGYTDDAIMHLGITGKGTNFIQKPFNLDSLPQKVREVLDSTAV